MLCNPLTKRTNLVLVISRAVIVKGFFRLGNPVLNATTPTVVQNMRQWWHNAKSKNETSRTKCMDPCCVQSGALRYSDFRLSGTGTSSHIIPSLSSVYLLPINRVCVQIVVVWFHRAHEYQIRASRRNSFGGGAPTTGTQREVRGLRGPRGKQAPERL
ncbi:uncharacterized protein PV07_07092 [Cladophialophora immunda]|uniref:Uncharacterized protein n=1 Tax=Cladophialophora immunda TaxID=569365 RepID=A0A0D2C896_9EURO|nr:uncharacterized protein PV07_07092 [Cladophialophora immunda]KIW27348.1 hypothetical protein PV07_07092 [Cladophialophora immunda]